MRFLVDTNVFLDFFLNRQPFADDAKNFFQYCFKNKCGIYVSSLSLRDIGYCASRILHDAKKGKDIQHKTYSICTKVIGISADAGIEALFSDICDYEDALISVSAMENCLDAIITNNTKDFINSKTHSFTPKEVTEKFSSLREVE